MSDKNNPLEGNAVEDDECNNSYPLGRIIEKWSTATSLIHSLPYVENYMYKYAIAGCLKTILLDIIGLLEKN